jgi:NAD-dependent dihydropyrimidine dehydrogenase PreA subunit
MNLRVTFYDGPETEAIPAEERAALISGILAGGYGVGAALRGGEDEVRLARLRAGAGPEGEVHDIAGLDVNQVVALVDQVRDTRAVPAQARWKPWFPVIDYSRCTNCMQCLSFCLFDVYGVSGEGKIQVRNQTNCKTDCPACSRVCPEVAILFPKYKSGPINGDEIDAEDLRREAMKVDISALLGGDIYQALRDRSAKAKSRFSKERDEDRALKERQRCLKELQKQLDIPPEVLASLPPPEEILRRATAARKEPPDAAG